MVRIDLKSQLCISEYHLTYSIPCHVQITGRETRKLNDKQRRLEETAVRNKLDALKDDDDVFDVSYERQGGGAEDTVSATDIKVRPWWYVIDIASALTSI